MQLVEEYMNIKKEYVDIDNEVILSSAKKHSLPYSIVNYIYHLGYDTVEKIDDYLNPTRKSFYDPFLFPNMDKICERINKAIEQKEHIVVFGDYDADGIGSTAILYKYFKSIGVDIDYFLPSRKSDGYGLTIDSVDKIMDMYKPDLIITVDCGITCIKEVEYIKSLGVDIIITDHHEPLDTLPNCLCIDCKIKNQPYPFRYLCGAGMALKLVYALSDYETAKKYFTICAISTIADIVELVDENRFIVTEGLKLFYDYCPSGLRYMFKKLNIKGVPNSSDISFRVAPKINATGRMGDATIALKLYLTENTSEISTLYKKIIDMNEQRQIICQNIFEEAQKMIYENDDNNVIMLKKDNWETGVLGIVCAKLIEHYHKSVVLFGKDERTNSYVGSARAVDGVNIYNEISKLKEYLVAFGGHEMACGLTVSSENYDYFKNKLIEYMSNLDLPQLNYILYDIDTELNEIDFNYINTLNRLEPFGVANPKPRLMFETGKMVAVPMSKHNEHLIVKFKNFDGLVFNKQKLLYTISNKADKKIVFFPSIEEFASKKNIKLYIDDVYCDSVNYFSKDISEGSYFKQFIYAINNIDNSKSVKIVNDVSELPSENVLFISYFDNIDKRVKNSIRFDYVDYVYLSHKNLNDNTLIISPMNYDDFENFKSIVLLDKVIDSSFISYLQFKYPNSQVYILNNKNKYTPNVSTQKKVFVNFYKTISSIKEVFFDEINLYKKYFSKIGFDYKQFVFCLYVFEELGILNIDKGTDLRFTINSKIKTELTNSVLYNKMLNKGIKND